MSTNNIQHLNNQPPSVNLETMSPEAFLQHFVATFYQQFKGDKPSGFFTALHNDAVEGAWFRGRAQGMQEGYNKAIYDMELAQHQGKEFIKKLTS